VVFGAISLIRSFTTDGPEVDLPIAGYVVVLLPELVILSAILLVLLPSFSKPGKKPSRRTDAAAHRGLPPMRQAGSSASGLGGSWRRA